MEMGRSRRRAVGRRHGDGRRGFAVRFGRHRHAGIARALTSAHRSAMSGGDMTRRRGGVSPRETVQLRDTRHSARTRAAPPLSLTVPSHTLYRHSTALKPEPSEAALGKGSSRQTADTPGWFLTFGSGRASLGTLAVRVALPSGLLLPSGISLPHRVRIRYGTTHAPARPVQSGAPSGQRRAACQGAPCTRG